MSGSTMFPGDVPSPDEALDLADRVCALADGVPLQATVSAQRRRVTRLGNGHVLHNAEVEDVRVMVRAVVDGAEGLAFTNDLSADGLKRARDEAVGSARLSPKVPSHPGVPSELEAGVPAAIEAFDEALARGDARVEGEALARSFEVAREAGAVLAGVWVRCARARGVANTRGLRRKDRVTMSQARLIGTCDGASGHGGVLADRSDAVDLPALAAKAARTAVAGRVRASLPPGRYDVVLEPEAVIELLEWLGMIGFGSEPWEDGTSFLCGRVGEPVTGDRVTIGDPGPRADVLPIAFDDEGVARTPVTFVDRGRGAAVVHDRLSGQRVGCASTGHWGRNDRFPSLGASPSAIVMSAGADGDGDELVRKMRRGLHVHRFHYVNGFLDPKIARMTGLTRDGLFQVEDGRDVRAVRDLRFTEDILPALARIDGLGSTLRSVGMFMNDVGGANAAPVVLLRDFAFTGTCDDT